MSLLNFGNYLAYIFHYYYQLHHIYHFSLIQNNYIDTDGFKFYDYFSSVDIPCYEGYKNYDEIITDKTYQNILFEKDGYCLPNCAIKDIQLNLLRAFPYPLSQEAQKLLNELEKSNK